VVDLKMTERAPVTFELGDVKDYREEENLSCTLIALAAVTGKRPHEVKEIIHELINRSGGSVGQRPLPDYNIDHWRRALMHLGGTGTKTEDYRGIKSYLERPTIDQWMLGQRATGPRLVVCEDGSSHGHVFATQGGDFVDCYTAGKRVKFIRAPDDYSDFHVKLVFRAD
jgi:hypothetical protein